MVADVGSQFRPLLSQIPDDVALEALARVPKMDHNSLRAVSKSWSQLMTSSQLFEARKQQGATEKWLFVLPEAPVGGPFRAYDAVRDVWTSLPPLPGRSATEDLAGFSCVAASGRLFVMGGVPQRMDPSSNKMVQDDISSKVIAFDPVTWRWSHVSPMREARAWAAACAIPFSGDVGGEGARVVVCGGQGRRSFLASAEVYDPETDTWSEIASMSSARMSHQCCAVGGRAWAVGGEVVRHGVLTHGNPSEQTQGASVEVYDPQSNSWGHAEGAWLSTQRVPSALTTHGPHHIYTLQSSSLFRLDTRTLQWTDLGPVTPSSAGASALAPCTAPSPRFGFSLRSVSGCLLLVGGKEERKAPTASGRYLTAKCCSASRTTVHRLSTVQALDLNSLEAEEKQQQQQQVGAQAEGHGAEQGPAASKAVLQWRRMRDMGKGSGSILASAVLTV